MKKIIFLCSGTIGIYLLFNILVLICMKKIIYIDNIDSIYEIVSLLSICLLILVMIKIFKANNSFNYKYITPKGIVLGIIGCYLVNFVMTIVILTAMANIFTGYAETLMEYQNSITNSYTGILGVLAVVICGPILEEVMCRGIIFSNLRRLSGFWCSAVISSAVWAILHFDVITTITTFCLGIFLAYMYEVTKTIWVPIIMHITNNLIATIMPFGGQSGDIPPFSILDGVLCCMVGSAILVGVIKLIKNMEDGEKQR